MRDHRSSRAPLSLASVALLVLFGAAASGCDSCKGGSDRHAAPPAANSELGAAQKHHGRLIMLGFDGVDPRWLERWMKGGKLPTLAKLTAALDGHAYQHLHSTNPPQSPVAWTSFAAGTPPGEHGIYDFIARTLDANGAIPILPKVATTSFEVQPDGPPVARNLRTGQA